MTLDDKLIAMQNDWTNDIQQLNEKMKSIPKLNELLSEIYTKRQNAVDLYFGMMKVLAAQTRIYKAKYATIYNNIKCGQNNIRYTNETSLNIQVESQISDEKAVIDMLTNFTGYMKETIQTIDNMIYGINNKIKVHELINGLKTI